MAAYSFKINSTEQQNDDVVANYLNRQKDDGTLSTNYLNRQKDDGVANYLNLLNSKCDNSKKISF